MAGEADVLVEEAEDLSAHLRAFAAELGLPSCVWRNTNSGGGRGLKEAAAAYRGSDARPTRIAPFHPLLRLYSWLSSAPKRTCG